MKKLLLLAMSVSLILLCCACGAQEAPPVEGMQAIGMYQDFVKSIESAKVVRSEMSFKDVFSFVSYYRESIAYSHNEEGKHVFTYKKNYPFVIGYITTTDYYDGDNYYYKYNKEWFLDHYSQFNKKLNVQHLAIPDKYLQDYKVISDKVSPDRKGWIGKVQSEDEDGYSRLEMTFWFDADKHVKKLEINVISTVQGQMALAEAEAQLSSASSSQSAQPQETVEKDFQEKLITKYTIEYDRYNQEVSVTPPKDFDHDNARSNSTRQK